MQALRSRGALPGASIVLAALLLSAPLPAAAAEDAAPASAPAAKKAKAKRAPVAVVGHGNSVNPSDPELYAGSAECLTCHEDESLYDMRRTAHLPLFLPERFPAHLSGCEACHGPGKAHADAGRASKIRGFAKLTPAERSLACLQCHAGDRDRVNLKRSAHDVNQVACDSCHRAHAPADDVSTETCQSCHPETKADFALPFRHGVPDGAMSCTDCHAQHGAAGRQLRRHDTDEICASCHAEQSGPFIFEHLPRLFGGCTTCHEPHGSANPHQLIRQDVNETCLECHVNTSDSHDQSDGLHDQCITCHSHIHGSNIDQRFAE